MPKCVDFPNGEIKEAKSLYLKLPYGPYQFNNDDEIEKLFGDERPTFESRNDFPEVESEVEEFTPEARNNESEVPESDYFTNLYDYNLYDMFNDFETIDTQTSFESHTEAQEFQETDRPVERKDENITGGFFKEKKRSSKKNTICEKLNDKNRGRFFAIVILRRASE